MSKKYHVVYTRNNSSITEKFDVYENALNRYYTISSTGAEKIRIEEINESSAELLTE